jgi:hypothetical protein
MAFTLRGYAATVALLALGCSDGSGRGTQTTPEPSFESDAGVDAAAPGPDASADAAVWAAPDPYALANGCYTLETRDGKRLVAGPDGVRFAASAADQAARLFLEPSDLGSYLFFDRFAHYIVAENGQLLRQANLLSDILTLDDTYQSPAEWELVPIAAPRSEPARFFVRHRKTQGFLAAAGLVRHEDRAAQVHFEPSSGCAEHPELTLDAAGRVERTTFEDGTLYGIVDTHSHLLTNFGFGGGGLFHGAPFHRLGVAHALPDCEMFHGPMGRKDFFGYAFSSGHSNPDVATFLPMLITGELGADNHRTAGWPDFSDWPNAPSSATHQTQYYRWLERAWLAGLRLVVQLATTNQIICDFMVGEGYQPVRYSCNDMVGVDRSITEARNMERYIDAQAGGPGRGFFRIVTSPAEARATISAGKMAVILGIETSNLFDCFSVPHAGAPSCDATYLAAQLDAYAARGVRAIFPVHKYDNAFSAGDGNRGFIELGNFLNSGHWSNFVEDCPAGVSGGFDQGSVAFGGLNKPRDRYDAAPPNDTTGFAERPVLTVTPHMLRLLGGKLEGDYCQKTGMTELGDLLMLELMKRGMLIEIDHLPRRSYARAFELLEEHDYPPIGSHGRNHEGRVYALGGVSKTGLGRCREPGRKGAMTDRLRGRIETIEAMGGYPAEGFGFDLNGLAGAPGPRFGPHSECAAVQDEPLTYPFDSLAGDVTFTEPRIGTRTIDFNTEGMVHIGLLPELLEDARRDAESDADLLPLFRSAEGYIRAWERAEERGRALAAEL